MPSLEVVSNAVSIHVVHSFAVLWRLQYYDLWGWNTHFTCSDSDLSALLHKLWSWYWHRETGWRWAGEIKFILNMVMSWTWVQWYWQKYISLEGHGNLLSEVVYSQRALRTVTFFTRYISKSQLMKIKSTLLLPEEINSILLWELNTKI